MKTCPFCRAEAPDDAPTCGACGKSFDQPDAAPGSQGATAGPPAYGLAPETVAKDSAPSAEARTEDDVGLTACPQCKTDWEPDAVVCVVCGYDARTGRQLSTVRGVEEPPPIIRPATGLGPVRVGLFLHLIVVSLWLISIPVGVILMIQRAELAVLLESAAEGGELERSPFIAALVMALTIIILAALQWVLGLIGSVLCLWIPRESEARGWLIASLVLGVAVVPVGIAIVWFSWPALLLNVLWLPSWAAWIMSVRNIAYYLERREEAQETVGILVQMLIVLFLIPMVGFTLLFMAILWLIYAFACLGAVVGIVASVSAFVLWLIYYVKVLFSLFQLIETLRQELLPKPSEAGAPAVDQAG